MTENILNVTHTIGILEKQIAEGDSENVYEKNQALFWLSVVTYLCISLVAVSGNSLVIYAAHGNNNTGPLRYLDNAVKSLAIADMMFGLVGTPLLVVNYYWGKN